MTQPSAKVIADSISDDGKRLTTLEVVMHRFVLAEFNTHRVFSRNSASSRAIPVHKIMDRVAKDPCRPVIWPRKQAGMQGGLPFNETGIKECTTIWDYSRFDALDRATALKGIGLHKSLTNRLLEPYMWHTVIVTATEWDNFFHQRCHPDAQPEMKAAADAMQLAYYRSAPKELAHGEWHTPYINDEDRAEVEKSVASHNYKQKFLKCVSVARCARVSYLTHDGVRDMQIDIDLYDKLQTSGHWSPFEHVATPVKGERVSNRSGSLMVYHGCGNFVGWKQFRKEFKGENRTQFLPNLPELAQVRMRMEAGYTPWVSKGDSE